MIEENSGKIYRFPLIDNLGYGYAELLDYSDVAGIFIQVYDIFSEGSKVILKLEDILNSKILFGPETINKFPNVKGRKSWKYVGRNENFTKEFPSFKNYFGYLGAMDWSVLKPFKEVVGFGLNTRSYVKDFEEIRHLPPTILNHKDSIPDKISMMKIIQMDNNVFDYFDFTYIGNRNIYVHVINTYYPKEKADELIKELKEFHFTKMKEMLNEGKDVFDSFEILDSVNNEIYDVVVKDMFTEQEATKLINEMNQKITYEIDNYSHSDAVRGRSK